MANYYILGKWLGKPFLEKYGRYILITKDKYEKTEKLFLKNDKIYTFIGRLIPVVRHLISIPAGIFSMPLHQFAPITFLGATLWCSILVILGYTFGDTMTHLLSQYSNEVGYFVTMSIIFYLWWKIFKK